MKNWRIVRAAPSGRLEAVPGANFWTSTAARKGARHLNDMFFDRAGFAEAFNTAINGRRRFQAMTIRQIDKQNKIRQAALLMSRNTEETPVE
jgi:hypothetical protein